jgi:hypothetical protein
VIAPVTRYTATHADGSVLASDRDLKRLLLHLFKAMPADGPDVIVGVDLEVLCVIRGRDRVLVRVCD